MALLSISKEQIEMQMLTFLNLLDNFSKTSDDLINILDRANQYMKAPVYEIVNDFVLEVRLYGNQEVSFRKVCERFRGTKMEDIFRILKICSEHDANYSEVIQDMKLSIKEYLKSQKIRKAIINSARVDLMALFFAGYIVLQMLDDFLKRSAIKVCASSPVGIGILVYCAVVVSISVYYVCIKKY